MSWESRDDVRELERLAEHFRALGHPRRIAILQHLQPAPLRTKELSKLVNQPFKDINYDLGQLAAVGAVTRAKNQQWPYGGSWSVTPMGRILLEAVVIFRYRLDVVAASSHT